MLYYVRILLRRIYLTEVSVQRLRFIFSRKWENLPTLLAPGSFFFFFFLNQLLNDVYNVA